MGIKTPTGVGVLTVRVGPDCGGDYSRWKAHWPRTDAHWQRKAISARAATLVSCARRLKITSMASGRENQFIWESGNTRTKATMPSHTCQSVEM
jgi:hypothetical protein